MRLLGPYERTLRTNRRSKQPCWVGCFAGCRHLGLESNGGVKGCLSLQATRDTEGNVRTRALGDLWRDPNAFAYNRRFSVDQLSGFCRTCAHVELCRGGCRSLRMCQGGGENRFCYHRVATEADATATATARRYVLALFAPAMVSASLGAGCGASEYSTAVYAAPIHDTGADTQTVDVYGIQPQTGPEVGPAETGPDVQFADAYGVVIDAPVYAVPFDTGADASDGD